jgi:hypothetical protein
MKMSVDLLSVVVAAFMVSGAEAQTDASKVDDLFGDLKPPPAVYRAPNYVTLSKNPDYLVLQRALTTATAPPTLQKHVYTLPASSPLTLPNDGHDLRLNYPDYLVLGRTQAAAPTPSTLSNQNNATPPPSLSSLRMPTEGESLALSFGAYKTFRAGQTMTIAEMTTEMIANGAERTFAQETAPLALRMISSSPVRGASAVIAVAAGAWAIYQHFVTDDAKPATAPGFQPIAR